jgi:oligogalacturonide lyase
MTIAKLILKQMPAVRQPQAKFLTILFSPLLTLRGYVMLRHLSRYRDYSARTLARHFRAAFNGATLHRLTCAQVVTPADVCFREMKKTKHCFLLLLLLAVTNAAQPTAPSASQVAEPPLEWIEPETGHRVVRLSREAGTASLYFHQNAYTASGDKLVVTTPKGIATIELKTGKIELIVTGRASHLVVGRQTRQVFYHKDGAVLATHLDTKTTREIVRHPDLRSGSGFAINADETLLGGSFIEGGAQPPPNPVPANQRGDSYPGKGQMMEQRLAARLPMALYTINLQSGAVTPFYRATDWLNHVQFSPTDPTLMMFCHEGPWHKVDRIWTIRTDGTNKQLMHQRTMDMEIAGHEFFSADGKTVWYDLQTPKGKEFWLAGVELASGQQTRYKVAREHWSVHFNVAPNGKLFAGDGGGPSSVAAPGNGQWIYLFTPRQGALQAKKLVNLARHDYRLEPNVTFTPDLKWIVFRSNLHGATHVYAVEVAKRFGSR